MHLGVKCIPEKVRNKIQILVFAVTLFKAIDTTSLFLKVHVTRIERVILRVNFASVLAVFRVHGTACFKFSTITQDNSNFVVFWMDSVFHDLIISL